MKTIFTLACFLALSWVDANVSLSNLIETDKATCLGELEKATDARLWDSFLKGQAKLFFDSEFAWINKGVWWQRANSVLEIGSGNGAYLYKLSQQFQDKTFKGIEKLSQPVEQANEQYAWSNLIFQEGDAEIFDDQLINSADIVLFRLILQYLKDPFVALENAFHYLSSNGYIVIIDSYDMARKSSHPVPVIDEAITLVAEVQKTAEKGNRKVTLELLQMIERKTSSLSAFYEVVSSNLDINGNVIGDRVCFQGAKGRALYCNNSLLLLTLWNRIYPISVDLNKAYDELQDYLNDENAWTSPGMHFLVLKKKPTKTPTNDD